MKHNISDNVTRVAPRDRTIPPPILKTGFFPLFDVLSFDAPNDVWLDFVSSNRDGMNIAVGHDMIFGPVANDDVYRTFALYRNGELTREEALTRLKVKRLYNQLVFATERALRTIRFKGSEVVHV